VQEEAGRPAYEFLEKMERIYRKAADKGMLRQGLEPIATARDTWAFTSGLLHLMLGCQKGSGLDKQIPAMISTHMELRRRS